LFKALIFSTTALPPIIAAMLCAAGKAMKKSMSLLKERKDKEK